LPGANSLGIDLAARPIAQGRAIADALGLKNLSLNQEDITEVSLESGRYDYIIAHGVYSWVSPTVQDKLLEICSNNLASNGVAYVSYNTFPGWHLSHMVREMMLFHTRQYSEPALRMDHGLALIKFLAESKSEPDLYHAILKREIERLMQRSKAPSTDELAAENSLSIFPVYRARRQTRAPVFVTVTSELDKLGDNVIAQEQCLDF
jgi:SAM-dependent methyltransferase